MTRFGASVFPLVFSSFRTKDWPLPLCLTLGSLLLRAISSVSQMFAFAIQLRDYHILSPVLFLPDLVLSLKHSVFPQHGGNVLPLTVARRGPRWYRFYVSDKLWSLVSVSV